MIFRFGHFEADEERFELLRDGKPVPVQPRVLETLFCLLRARGRLVAKDDLVRGPWHGVAVTDAALSQCIMWLRRALGGSEDQQGFITTVRGKGFRFTGCVEQLPAPGQSIPQSSVSRSAASMVEPLILRTKMHRPQHARALTRPRLIEAFGASAPRLTTVIAPAGSGKSVATSQWVASLGCANVWLTLGPEDDRADQFLLYFVEALRQAEPAIGAELGGLLQSPGSIDLERAFDGVVVCGLQGRTQPIVFVIDDFHVVSNADIHRAIDRVLEWATPEFRLVLVSRELPPLRLARLRAQGDLNEITNSVLRFTPGEARDFYAKHMDLELTPDQLSRLLTCTEGWVAGMQLVGLAVRNAEDKLGFIASVAGDDRRIADYLVDEVLSRLGYSLRTFLLKTSVLSRMCNGLAKSLFEGDDCSFKLEELERKNLLLVPMDDRRVWYRYHHLFRELLARHLTEVASAQEIAELHARASSWFAGQGLKDESMDHAILSGRGELVIDLFERCYKQMLNRGEVLALQRWLEHVPPSVYEHRPIPPLVGAVCAYLSDSTEAALALVEQGERALASVELPVEEATFLRCLVLLVRSFCAFRSGDYEGCYQMTAEGIALLPAAELVLRAAFSLTEGLAHAAEGDSARARACFAHAQRTGLEGGNLLAALWSMAMAARSLRTEGRLDEAEHICREALERGTEAACGLMPVLGVAQLELASVLLSRRRLPEAKAEADKGVERLRLVQLMDELVPALIVKARVEAALGAYDASAGTLGEASALARQFKRSDYASQIEAMWRDVPS